VQLQIANPGFVMQGRAIGLLGRSAIVVDRAQVIFLHAQVVTLALQLFHSRVGRWRPGALLNRDVTLGNWLCWQRNGERDKKQKYAQTPEVSLHSTLLARWLLPLVRDGVRHGLLVFIIALFVVIGAPENTAPKTFLFPLRSVHGRRTRVIRSRRCRRL